MSFSLLSFTRRKLFSEHVYLNILMFKIVLMPELELNLIKQFCLQNSSKKKLGLMKMLQ